MATLPSASVSIDAEAGALAGGTGYCVVVGAVADNDDAVPRVFSSARGIFGQHGYSQAADYAALHIENTGKPVLFIGLPIATPGTVGRINSTGVTGSSSITAAVGGDGALDEVDGILTVTTAGDIGTNGIVFTLSLDGGRSEKTIRLGTATSYTVPYVGITISFGAGDLNVGDVYTFTSTAPMWDSDGLSDARTNLTAQQKLARSWMVIGDIENSTFAGYVTTELNAYETSVGRYSLARVNARDHLPLAAMSQVTKRMVGTTTITFLEAVDADTITRATGSFIADGFAVGDIVTVAGAVASAGANNVTGVIDSLTATVITFDATTDLVNEGPISGVSITASPGIVFEAAGDTITRANGSWLADGFRVGDSVTIDDTTSNDATRTITVLTATVMTFASGLTDETIRSDAFTLTKGETLAAWIADVDADLASVDGQKRIDIAVGRLRHVSPLTSWNFRRPVAWAASIREYQKDVHIPTWRKEDGPLLDWSMVDEDGTIVEFDERTDGGGLAGRFTCARTWANGPNGPFIAMSLTRDTEGSVLSYTHNMAVANVACTIVQIATENVVGKVLQLNDDGTATKAALQRIEESINTDLEVGLLQEKVSGAGPRASKAVWRANETDDLSVVDATLTGVLDLHVNGTVVHVDTVVKVS